MALNMSQGTVVTTSDEMLGRTPAPSSLSAGGRPWSICISSSGAIEGRTAGLADDLELAVIDPIGVDVGDIRPEHLPLVHL